MKKYVSKLEDLNEYEREHGKISYRRLIERLGKVWLFNQAIDLADDFEIIIGTDYCEEEKTYKDIYQYYLIDIKHYDIETLKNSNCKDVIIAWSETLQEYILMVDHFGTSWDYVLTDIEYTTDFNEADL